jgi:hypothetical protein
MVRTNKSQRNFVGSTVFQIRELITTSNDAISVELVRHNVGDIVSEFWGSNKCFPADVSI